ncbi:MAG: hypothetical protein Unbinned92contig1003_41 [Prokaryotic dsDNA virus sp.]|nr:MAG: hypothetical protein Unbinned92contig1003_41 [Prokaryotic dsDNA virus sp.]|tara:strand:+ start:5092 stop:5349 length:258 start_codon:yes stop_codon:yes gene_type:complete
MNKYSEIYNETCLVQVQKVKLGDVTYSARCKLIVLEDLLKNAEERQVEYKQQDNSTLVEWYQGQIEAYKLSIELFKDLVKQYNKL